MESQQVMISVLIENFAEMVAQRVTERLYKQIGLDFEERLAEFQVEVQNSIAGEVEEQLDKLDLEPRIAEIIEDLDINTRVEEEVERKFDNLELEVRVRNF